MSRSKIVIKSTNRRRGTVPLAKVRKAIETVLANYDEQRKLCLKAKGSLSTKAK